MDGISGGDLNSMDLRAAGKRRETGVSTAGSCFGAKRMDWIGKATQSRWVLGVRERMAWSMTVGMAKLGTGEAVIELEGAEWLVRCWLAVLEKMNKQFGRCKAKRRGG